MESFGKSKTPEELDAQLGRSEHFFKGRIQSESVREALLAMSTEELKATYPKEYAAYLSYLHLESRIRQAPDMPEGKPLITKLSAPTRGSGIKASFEHESRIIKPLESIAEKSIAQTAADMGIGPEQYKAPEGMMHEQFVDGTPLLNLEADICTPAFMEDLGQKFGKALKALHEKNILVNDQLLTNDFGKSHVILTPDGDVRFVDFGASIDVSHFPEISDDDVVSLMRTDPFMQFSIGAIGTMSPSERTEYISGYRKSILSQFKTKEDIIHWKDLTLLNEGLYFLQDRLPNVGSFAAGVEKELSYR